MHALIFDFDGLILDTETPEVEVWQAIFREHGCTFPDEWWMNAIGRGADQVTTLPEDLLEEQLGKALDRPAFKTAHRARLLAEIDRQPIRPGVVDLATEARATGIHVGIASSSYHDWVDGYLEKHGIRNLFEEVVCAEDVERGKPFPDLYLEALLRFKCDPCNAVSLEDSPNGIRAAKAAGLFCIVVPNTASARCDVSLADARIESLQGIKIHDIKDLMIHKQR